MSVSSQVIDTLNTNPAIEVMQIKEKDHFPSCCVRSVIHEVNILVAAVHRTSDLGRLQTLLGELAPQPPTKMTSFELKDDLMVFGQLRFDETVVLLEEDVVQKFTLLDPSFNPGNRFVNGRYKVDRHGPVELIRRTSVTLIPSITHARKAIRQRLSTFSYVTEHIL
jgi:hypothetical protein